MNQDELKASIGGPLEAGMIFRAYMAYQHRKYMPEGPVKTPIGEFPVTISRASYAISHPPNTDPLLWADLNLGYCSPTVYLDRPVDDIPIFFNERSESIWQRKR